MHRHLILKANGFTDNVPLEPIEGAEQKEQVTAYVNAVAGIQSCRLTTTSDFLSEKGWPATPVDLVDSGEYASIFNRDGLENERFGRKSCPDGSGRFYHIDCKFTDRWNS